MTRDEILAMPAGREMDALVAEKVMEWTRNEDGTWWVGDNIHKAPIDEWYEVRFPHQPRKNWGPYSPSTDIAAAMSALGKWEGDCQLWRQNGQWRVELFKPSREWQAWSRSLPHAICLALLKGSDG